ncbi:hypothetical protein F511_15659 [Dorcoceras hygrometricum]|uniref:Uncharacterized protein n=1 Tax=Dorcoceras hygrometricum TaxID=472368 RepID=A0A2Z7BXP2_9LAMI|nr:hypothetical protein F511_15659 [Dorcoceras hygrometricum]
MSHSIFHWVRSGRFRNSVMCHNCYYRSFGLPVVTDVLFTAHAFSRHDTLHVVSDCCIILLFVLGFNPMFIWGWLFCLPACCSGLPDYSTGLGVDPAGGASGEPVTDELVERLTYGEFLSHNSIENKNREHAVSDRVQMLVFQILCINCVSCQMSRGDVCCCILVGSSSNADVDSRFCAVA